MEVEVVMKEKSDNHFLLKCLNLAQTLEAALFFFFFFLILLPTAEDA